MKAIVEYLSRVRGNLHARFLGEGAAATLLPYPTTVAKWSVGVLAAHLLGKEEDRVRFPNGPLDKAGRWSNGKTPGLHPGNRGSIPRRSTERTRADGPMGRRQAGSLEIRVQFPVGPLE